MPVNTGYGQGTSFTNASGPGGMDISPYLQALIASEQRFMQQRANTGARPQQGPFGGMRTVRPQLRMNTERPQGLDSAQHRLLNAQASKAHAEAQAVAGRAPLRTSFVGGQVVITPDSNAMTGAQRQAHLPGGSSFQGSINEGGGFGPGPQVYGGPASEFASSEAQQEEHWKYQQQLEQQRKLMEYKMRLAQQQGQR